MSLHALVETTASREHAVVPPIADIFLDFLIPVSASRKTTASNESVFLEFLTPVLASWLRRHFTHIATAGLSFWCAKYDRLEDCGSANSVCFFHLRIFPHKSCLCGCVFFGVWEGVGALPTLRHRSCACVLKPNVTAVPSTNTARWAFPQDQRSRSAVGRDSPLRAVSIRNALALSNGGRRRRSPPRLAPVHKAMIAPGTGARLRPRIIIGSTALIGAFIAAAVLRPPPPPCAPALALPPRSSGLHCTAGDIFRGRAASVGLAWLRTPGFGIAHIGNASRSKRICLL